jgi:hypothetical protein
MRGERSVGRRGRWVGRPDLFLEIYAPFVAKTYSHRLAEQRVSIYSFDAKQKCHIRVGTERSSGSMVEYIGSIDGRKNLLMVGAKII